jgi:hypothetical protein
MPFAIIDRGHGGDLYIHRTWQLQSEAEWERLELLYGFPKENEWHRRLQVVPWANPTRIRTLRPRKPALSIRDET